MGLKKKYQGLWFSYKFGNKLMKDKYQTVEEFLKTALIKNNLNAPKGGTEIFNIRYNGDYVNANLIVNTLKDLYTNILNNATYSLKKYVYARKEIKKYVYVRKEIYSIDDVYVKIKDVLDIEKKCNYTIVNFDGDLIYGNSQRYQLFFHKGVKCVSCGITGEFFAKEKGRNDNSSRYHLNLYAIDKDGNEVLMTKDHIVPKSRGGKDCLDNYQPMCAICNSDKGNKMEDEKFCTVLI